MWKRNTDKCTDGKKCFHHLFSLLFRAQGTHLILITASISDKLGLLRQCYRVHSFQFVFHFQTSWRNMTQGYLGGSEENPFIIPGVCGVGEINRGVHAGFIYILLCEPNTLTWGKEDEWVVWGEEVREFQRQGGAPEGKRKLEMERWKSCLHTKFLVRSHRLEQLRLERLWGSWEFSRFVGYNGCTNITCEQRRRSNPGHLPSLRDIDGDKSVCDFSEKRIKEEHKAVGDAPARATDFQLWKSC